MRRFVRDLTAEEADGLDAAVNAMEAEYRTWLARHDGSGDRWMHAIVVARGRIVDAMRCLRTELLTWGVGTSYRRKRLRHLEPAEELGLTIVLTHLQQLSNQIAESEHITTDEIQLLGAIETILPLMRAVLCHGAPRS